MGITAIDEFDTKVDTNWAGLKDQGKGVMPEAVERLRESVELWLDGEEFEYLYVGGDKPNVYHGQSLKFFGLTRRLVLSADATKPSDDRQIVPPGFDLRIAPRAAIKSLEPTYDIPGNTERLLVMHATWEGLRSPRFWFPPIDDEDADPTVRRELFLSLRDDLYS